MEKEAGKGFADGWIYLPDRKTIWQDRRSEDRAPYLPGGRISGIFVVRLEPDQRQYGNAQQTGRSAHRKVDRNGAGVAAEDDSWRKLEEKRTEKVVKSNVEKKIGKENVRKIQIYPPGCLQDARGVANGEGEAFPTLSKI